MAPGPQCESDIRVSGTADRCQGACDYRVSRDIQDQERSYESKYVPSGRAGSARPGDPMESWVGHLRSWRWRLLRLGPGAELLEDRRGTSTSRIDLPGYVFSAKEVWDGLEVGIDGKATIVCNGLLRDWANWIREGGRAARDMRDLLVSSVALDDARDRLEPGPLTDLCRDAGTSRSLRAASPMRSPSCTRPRACVGSSPWRISCLWSRSENRLAAQQLGESPAKQVVLMIDELESHLHPRWQHPSWVRY